MAKQLFKKNSLLILLIFHLLIAGSSATAAIDNTALYPASEILRVSINPPSEKPTYKSKAWKTREIKLVNSLDLELEKEFPELVSKASCGFPIHIYREIDSLKVASTDGDSIQLTDWFFRLSRKQQKLSLVHELLHMVDRAHIYSNNPLWQEACDAFFEGYTKASIPIDYCECFARVLSKQLLSLKTPLQIERNSKLWKEIFKPLAGSEMNNALLMRRSMEVFEKQDYEQTHTYLDELEKAPDYRLWADGMYISMYYRQKKESECLQKISEVLGRLDAKQNFSITAISIRRDSIAKLMDYGRFDKARDVASKLIEKYPDCAKLYEIRSKAYERGGYYKEYLADLSKWKSLRKKYKMLQKLIPAL